MKRKMKGITLISLVITIIVLLILAGVSIAMLSGDNGLITQVLNASKNTKLGEMEDEVGLAIASVRIDDYKKPLVLDDIYAKMEENGVFKDTDKVWDKIDETKAEFLDKSSEVILVVTVEGGNVTMDKEIPSDFENREILQVNIEQKFDVATEKTILDVTGSSNKGIEKIIVKKPDGTSETITDMIIDGENFQKEIIIESNGVYEVEVYGEEKVFRKTIVITNYAQAPEITFTPQEATNEDVTVTITYSREGSQGLTNQYSIDGTNWITVDAETKEISIDENGTIYAGYLENGTKKLVKTANILNIDKSLPNEFNVTGTSTTNSITISGSTTDAGSEGTAEANIGIEKYRVKILNSDNSIRQDWTDIGLATTHTFNDLTQDTIYKVSMIAIDKAGNVREVTNVNHQIRTTSVTGATTTNLIMTPSTANPTNANITVAMSTTTGLDIEYKIGSGNWTDYTSAVSITANGTIYARLLDNAGQGGTYRTLTISNIDKVAPNAFNISASKTTNSITVSGSTTDTGSTGTAAANIGIVKYEIRLLNSAATSQVVAWTSIGTKTSHTFSNLAQNTTYRVSMRATDKAGNVREVTNLNASVVTSVVASGSSITMTPSKTTPTNQNITVSLSTSTGLRMQYKIGTGAWTNYSSTLTITANTPIYARLLDSTGQAGTYKTLTINNIDKIAPNAFTIRTTSILSTSATMAGSTTDAASAGTSSVNTGIARYDVILYNSSGGVLRNWTSNSTKTTFKYQTLWAGASYSIQMRAVDKAGNIRVSNILPIKMSTVYELNVDYPGVRNESLTDRYGNKLKLPEGFKVIEGDDVMDGIVVEDAIGNEFVWIPVGTIKLNSSGTTTTIALSRYEFSSTGVPTAKADLSDIVTYRGVNDEIAGDGVYVGDNIYQERYPGTGWNTVAENLTDFKSKVAAAGGYYIARFEASNSNGVATSTGATAWRTTQPASATAARAMDKNSAYYKTDLVNSLAWDTAIVFIQKAVGSYSYAVPIKKTSLPAVDEMANIRNLRGGVIEWSTETVYRGDPYSDDSKYRSTVYRGATYYQDEVSAVGRNRGSMDQDAGIGFRVIMYL